METLNDHDSLEQWQLAIEQARAFLPNDPTNAVARLRQLESELRGWLAKTHGEHCALEPLAAEVAALVLEAEDACARWQAASAQREQSFHIRERSPLLRH